MPKTIPSQGSIKAQKYKQSMKLRNEALAADPTCRVCGKTKTVADFPKKTVDYSCTKCRGEYAAALYRKKRDTLSDAERHAWYDAANERSRKNRVLRIARMGDKERAAFAEKISKDNLTRMKKVKDIVYGAYGGYVCACCGETEPKFLTIDHINNDGAKHKREYNLTTGEKMYRWIVRNNFPKDFQILCMNCNWGKRGDGVCPHRTRCND